MFDLALKAGQKGEHWPIWGTCIGFEFLVFHTINDTYSLETCSSEEQAVPLEVTANFMTSRIGHAIPKDVFRTLTTTKSTVNFHQKCLSPTNFTLFEMDKFWNVLSTNFDWDGLEFISFLEAKDYPIWGSTFHPEKIVFEWTSQYPNVPHDSSSIHAATFFAQFFVEETRKNSHKFITREAEEKHLIYRHTPYFTGEYAPFDSIQKTIQFEQTYFF